MKTLHDIKNFFQSIKNYFSQKYYVIYELITLKLVLRVSNMVRKLIIAKGKDPDYVASPPSPKISDLWNERHHIAMDKINSQYRYNRSSSLNNKNVFRRAKAVTKSVVKAAPTPELDNALNVVIAAAEEAALTADTPQVVSTMASIAGEPVVSTLRPVLEDFAAFTLADRSVKIKELVEKMVSKGLCAEGSSSVLDQESELSKLSDQALITLQKLVDRK